MLLAVRMGIRHLKAKHDAESPMRAATANVTQLCESIKLVCAKIRAEIGKSELHGEFKASLNELKAAGLQLQNVLNSLCVDNERGRRLRGEFPAAKHHALMQLVTALYEIDATLRLLP